MYNVLTLTCFSLFLYSAKKEFGLIVYFIAYEESGHEAEKNFLGN